MKNYVMIGLLMLLTMIVSEAPVAADTEFGGQVSLASNDHDVGLGARILTDLHQFDEGLDFIGSFDIFFPEDDRKDYWELNLNAAYNLPMEQEDFLPYVGGGLNISHESFDGRRDIGDRDDTELGLNVLGGLKFGGHNFTPFVELRGEIKGGKAVVLTGGILF